MIENHILIIGAMKSGTTTLFDLLARHPKIAPSHPKEPGFFAFEDRWAEGFEWYETLFGFDPDKHVYALDGSTDYSKHPFCTGVPERLSQSAPRRFKLIYLLRHPLRRIESHAHHVQRKGKEIGQLPSPRPDHSLDAGISPVSLAVSRYASQLDRYRAFYKAGDLLILTFEELIADQTATLGRVLDFLGLEHIAVEAATHSNSADNKYETTAAWKMLTGLGPLTSTLKAILPEYLRRRMRKAMTKKVEATGRFSLTPQEEQEVLAQLAPEIDNLHVAYGVNTERLWSIAAKSPAATSFG